MKKILFLSVLVLCSVSFLLAEIIYVPDDEPTIQDAVDAASDGDEIVLREDDTYEESVSLNSFNRGELTIRSEYPDDWDCIESTIVDPPSINDNVFERTSAGTSSGIDLTIQGLTIKNGNNGIYLVETLYPYELVVQYCIIDDNDDYGILSNNITVLTIENCKIQNNGRTGIRTTHNWRNTLEIYDSEITGNTIGGVTDDVQIEIENCTIANNGFGVSCRNGTIDNSIIWDNTTQIGVVGGGQTTVAYSDVEGGYIGTGNINSNPIFETVGDNDYYLTWDNDDKSPCIDTGDPDSQYNDPDGTRNDMGAYYHPHDEKTYVFEGPAGAHDGLTWLCFDILDVYQASTTNQVQNLFDLIKLDLDHGEHENIWFEYIYPFWTNGTELVISPKGYKIEMDSENSIDVSGFRCKETTTFDLIGDDYDNWIGYFVDKTQHVYDAFDDYLDNINSIQHQEWSINGRHGWPDVPYTLSPGDMVVVECDENIDDFCWVRESEAERFIVQEPQNFSYTEEADYIPIYIYLEPTNLPDEIGVLIDGDCKGATVVHDTLANICAYITCLQYGSLEFEFSYGGRGINTSYKEYAVYDPQTGNQEITTIDLKDKQDYYYVSFRSPSGNGSDDLPVKLSASNYPNPFNPTTTISYNLPSDGNIELSIYNIRGQHVKNLIMGEQIAGSYEVIWNGKDNNEKSVSSGIYFYRLSTKDETIMKKILMLK
jgi:hypothetical protein